MKRCPVRPCLQSYMNEKFLRVSSCTYQLKLNIWCLESHLNSLTQQQCALLAFNSQHEIVTLKPDQLFGKITSYFVPAIQFLPGSCKYVIVPYLREIGFLCITALKHTGLFSGTKFIWHRVTYIHTVILCHPPKQPFVSDFWPILTPEPQLYWRCSRFSSRYCAIDSSKNVTVK